MTKPEGYFDSAGRWHYDGPNTVQVRQTEPMARARGLVTDTGQLAEAVTVVGEAEVDGETWRTYEVQVADASRFGMHG